MGKKQYDIFISYSSKDQDVAFTLCEALENEGLICWIAPRNVSTGHYASSIVKGIESSKVFVLVFSKNSNSSLPVLNEIELAMGSRLPLIPIRIEEVLPTDAMKFYVMGTNWFDVFKLKSLDDCNGFVSVVKESLENNDTITTVLPLKSSTNLKNNNVSSIKNILIFISFLIVILPLLYLFLELNKKEHKVNTLPRVEVIKAPIDEATKSDIAIGVLSNKLTKQTKKAEYFEKKYYELKERYKDYPILLVQGEKVQEVRGYEEAVSFYMDVKIDEYEKEVVENKRIPINKHRKPIDDAMFPLEIKEIDNSSITEEYKDEVPQLIESYTNGNKYALVLGIDNYEDTELTPLSGSINDTKVFTENFKKNNFEVQTLLNFSKNKIISSLRNLYSKVKKGDKVYLFFSGYGSSINSKNKNLFSSKNLLTYLEDGLIIPTDFDSSNAYKTAISMRRDIFPIIKKLDKKGVQVVVFSDVQFNVNNYYRSTSNEVSKFLPINLTSKVENYSSISYKNLMFFGTKHSRFNKEKNRGTFSMAMIYCLNNADSNNDLVIDTSEFKECLATEHSFFNYSTNNNFVLAKIKKSNKDTIKIRSSITFSDEIKMLITYQRENYDIEIIENGNSYKIIKYTGKHYATVKKKNLKKYLLSYRILNLKRENKLELSIKSQTTNQEERVYCNRETLNIKVKNYQDNAYLLILSLDKEGHVIILKPYRGFSSSFSFNLEVKPPFGIDILKVFALKKLFQFKEILKLEKKSLNGKLNIKGVEQLYKILLKDDSFQEKEVRIQTIGTNVEVCNQ